MVKNTAAVVVSFVGFAWSGIACAQTMPDKWDQKCLDDAGKKYIQCMASSGTNESAKQECQKTMADEKKLCKKK